MPNLFFLSRQLGRLCLEQKSTLALAESCTGGLLSAALTEVANSSQWFKGAAVVYSNEAKSCLLGVDPAIIARFGAVSPETAQAMARGALTKLDAQWALSITGIAGPGGGSVEKPVGHICFALACQKTIQTQTQFFTGGRSAIRQSAAEFALQWLISALQKS